MSHYRTLVDPAVRNSSQTLEFELVGPDRDVLDVGCASGDLAMALKANGCRVSGIEYDELAAESAKPYLQRLVVGDVTQLDLVDEFGAESFDAIVFGDVLEHLVDPAEVLQRSLGLLRPGGDVIISVPNVAHGSLRLALLQGRWRYTDEGLLDRTHLRFFTRESFLAMLRDAGLRVMEFHSTVMDPLGSEVAIADAELPGTIVDWVRHQPDAMTYQFVIRAVVDDPNAAVPESIPAVPIPVVEDVHSRRAQEEFDRVASLSERDELIIEVAELGRRVLTLRDHAVGAEASVGTARAEVERQAAIAEHVRGRLRESTEAVHERDRELHLARLELQKVRRSSSWRIGNTIVRPASALRRWVKRK